jgi:hypothetical protein
MVFDGLTSRFPARMECFAARQEVWRLRQVHVSTKLKPAMTDETRSAVVKKLI